MVDNNENILVEFDYQNISVIDPNKVIDNEGNVKDRLIKQEDLVFYANLECSVLPRTKLAVGVPQSEAIRTVSVGKINFLNPGFKQFLDNSYTDELTGKGALKGVGVNQPNTRITQNPDLSDDYYLSQTIMSNGNPGAVDTGLLGINQINIEYGTDFLPVISITMEDVKGRALFEAGDNSPYAAFFQLPYPLFYLTVKGYLGKAIRLPLMLHTFNASFDPSTHNFRINTQFYTYKYTIMSEVSWGAMYAVPSMYRVNIQSQKTTTSSTSNTPTKTEETYSSLGLQKMKELYTEYKAKGLIDDDFPEITVLQLKENLNKLITNIEEQFKKKNLNILNEVDKYNENLGEYSSEVYLYGGQDSWSRKYLDYENIFVKNDTDKTTLYKFKPEYSSAQEQITAIGKLTGLIQKYNNLLINNTAIGKDISVPINTKMFFTTVGIGDINVRETHQKRAGFQLTGNSTSDEYLDYKKKLNDEILNSVNLQEYQGLIFLTGYKSFEDAINKIEEKYKTKKQEVEEKLTKEISDQFASKTNGLGFQPTIRNVLAVFFAQGEAFLRMLDDVHTKAWDLRDDPLRRSAIFNTSSTVQSVDVKNGDLNSPVYPWPQIIGENLIEGKEKYTLKYPGDDDIANKLRAYVPEIWPEVQFVEEFLRGYTEKESPKFSVGDTNNGLSKPRRFSFNATEFTIGNDVYQNTEEVKFFYEIYERMYLSSFYSKLNRDSVKQYNVQTYVSESETTNLVTALGEDNPFLIQKIKEYNINSAIYGAFLKHISNSGEGQSWQKFIRGEFNTPYIKNDVDTSFYFYKNSILLDNTALPNVGLTNEDTVVNYFGGNIVNDEYDLTDLYPLTNLDWCKDYLANGKGIQSKVDTFKTSDTLQYDKSIKSIKNKNVLPITNFNYKKSVFDQSLNLQNLTTFYKNRKIKDQYATEGNLYYDNYNGGVYSDQTTSMFNTPYFANAIQKGVNEFKYSLIEKSPYNIAAYLFLNSLPLATLRDKYRIYNSDGSVTNASYILPSLKKFGAIHEMPYAWVLKYGSIWYRYKKWKEDNIDILDDVWKDTDYIVNYDPLFSASTTQYQVQIDGQPYDIVLDGTNTVGTNDKTTITTGFYPTLLDDFNFFLQGQNLFNQSTNLAGTCYIDGTFMEVLSINSNTLTPGAIISGSNINNYTTIITQISGTTGGQGAYYVTPSQSYPFVDPITSTQPFIVTNQYVLGYSSQSIQNTLNSNFRMVLSPTALINKSQGFDNGNNNRSLTIYPWSCYAVSPDPNYIYTLPSLGSNVNQVNEECFNNAGNLKIEVSNNPSIHNGSTRLFWQSPNYGYFDNSKVQKPQPDEYIRDVFNNTEEQENFGIFGDPDKYTKITELFTTFSPEILNKFEEQFLLFSQSVYDFESNLNPRNPNVNEEESYENFQGLMRAMFKTDNPKNLTGSALINTIKESQKNNIQKILESFMGYNVVFKYGNPSNFDKKMFYTFSNDFIEDPYTWGGYVQNSPNALPYAGGGITLAQSKTQYPITWNTLETYVGFSEIPKLEYTDNGSYITDFFIDMDMEFSENNIKLYHPIIKLYATQKLADPTLNLNKFYTLMTQYIAKGEQYLNLILDNTLVGSRAKLPNVKITANSTGVKFKEYDGDLVRLDTWESFKAINDKWISGADLRSKTLFEDVLLVDRASRDIGQKIFIDIFKLKTQIESMNYANNMLGIINTILVDNRFLSFILPAYANFYNVQDVSKTPNPRPEGTLEFANSLFGTHLNVDYRETTAKYLCVYSYVASKDLAMNTNVDYKFRDDAFDLRRATDNPLLESQNGKTNWDKSNKVVGFNVDFGPQNQQIFKQMDIGQNPGLPTSESLEMLNQMANQSRNRGGGSQSVSLYNVYRNRSYECEIDMMGCALIQPLMYFNLRHIPMFSGPYMITSVSHRISENGFDTSFKGQRQPFYSIPAIDNLLQSLSATILTTLKERVKEEDKKNAITETNNNLKTSSEALNKMADPKVVPTTNQDCSTLLNTSYSTYTATTPVNTSITIPVAYGKIVSAVNAITTLSNDEKLKFIDFIFMTIWTYSISGNNFTGQNNNYGYVTLDNNFGGSATYFNNSYFCGSSSNLTQKPFASFASFDSFLEFFIGKYKNNVSNLPVRNVGDNTQIQTYITGMSKSIMDTWPTNGSVWSTMTEQPQKQKIQNTTDAFTYIQNNQPKPTPEPEPNPPIFLTEIKYTNFSPPLLESYTIKLNPAADKRKMFHAELTVFGGTNAPCANTSGEVNLSNLIINGDTFTMGIQEILDAFDCQSGQPMQNYKGTYHGKFTVYSTPLLANGEEYGTREEYYKSFPLTFSF